MDFISAPFPAENTDEPRLPDQQAPSSSKWCSTCPIDGHAYGQPRIRPPAPHHVQSLAHQPQQRLLPAELTPPSPRQTQRPRRSPSQSAAPLGIQPYATVPQTLPTTE